MRKRANLKKVIAKLVAWHFGKGRKYCLNCKFSCHSCEKNQLPKTVEGMQAWEIIKTVYRPHLEKFPLIEALEFARLENLDLQIVKEYFIAASRGLKIGQ